VQPRSVRPVSKDRRRIQKEQRRDLYGGVMNSKQYKFTKKDIATASHQTVEKVRRDIRNGKLRPESLVAICCYVMSKRLLGVFE